MRYRIRVNLAFNSLDPAEDIRDKAKDFLTECINFNPGQPIQEIGYITLEECYHDEDPTIPCVVLYHAECPGHPA